MCFDEQEVGVEGAGRDAVGVPYTVRGMKKFVKAKEEIDEDQTSNRRSRHWWR